MQQFAHVSFPWISKIELRFAVTYPLPHAAFDIVIMNPPFIRSTGQEGRKVGLPRPMFPAFGLTDEERRLMSQATSKLASRTSVNRT